MVYKCLILNFQLAFFLTVSLSIFANAYKPFEFSLKLKKMLYIRNKNDKLINSVSFNIFLEGDKKH